MDDAGLAEKAKRGDINAFEQLVRAYTRLVFSAAYEVLEDRDMTQDAVQETFLKAWVKIKGFRGQSRFSTWLYSIARNTALDMLRRRKRDAAVSIDDVPEPSGQPGKAQQVLFVAMEKLSQRERECLLMRFQAGMTSAEIGEVLGLTEGNVRVIMFRARKKLRELLRGREDELLRG